MGRLRNPDDRVRPGLHLRPFTEEMTMHDVQEISLDTHRDQFQPGDRVNFFSSVGPCINGTLVKINRTKARIDMGGGNLTDEYHGMIHKPGTCPSCTSHPRTQYPNGYMD